MPTQQELMIARLVGDMKRAVKRRADESDSEDEIDQITNRGNKLKKKARYVHEGQLALPNGPRVYKKTITYNDHYTRDIISERPPLFDEDGYEMDSEDDENGEALAAANEFYPYNDVRIEKLLAPLTAAGDLPNHPTLSRPFTSKTLTELTKHARDMMQKEKASLWRMKHLLTKLGGDHTWIPTSLLETPNDLSFFGDGRSEYRIHLLEKNRLENEEVNAEVLENNANGEDTVMNGTTETQAEPSVPAPAPDTKTTEDDVAMVDVPHQDNTDQATALTKTESSTGTSGAPTINGVSEAAGASNSNGESRKPESAQNTDGTAQASTTGAASPTNAEQLAEDEAEVDPDTTLVDPDAPPEEEAEAKEDVDVPPPRRMRTRAQAQAASDDTARSRTRSLSSASNDSFVHPYFLAPIASIPDPDFGLPAQEAEETRRLLQLYIQKQEEICRGSQKLYDGLLTADRMRAKVMKWAKAEAHTGENGMSDGEDWYDLEEWCLDGELKKGHDEEEEDAVTTAKKTRTRRQ